MAPTGDISKSQIKFILNPNALKPENAATSGKQTSIVNNAASEALAGMPKTSAVSPLNEKKDVSTVLAGRNTNDKSFNSRLTDVNVYKTDSNKPSFGTKMKAIGYITGALIKGKGIDDEDPGFKKLAPEVQAYIREKAAQCSAQNMC